MNKLLISKEKFDEEFETHQEVRNTIEFEGQQVDVIDEGEIEAETFTLTKDEIRQARYIQS